MHELDDLAGTLDVAVAVNSLVMPDVRLIDHTLTAIRELRPEGVFTGVVPSIDAIYYHMMLLIDQSLDQGFPLAEAENSAALHVERRQYDFAFGRFQYEGLRQKFWLPFEVEYRLKKAGFSAAPSSKKCSILGMRASPAAGPGRVSAELGLVLPRTCLTRERPRFVAAEAGHWQSAPDPVDSCQIALPNASPGVLPLNRRCVTGRAERPGPLLHAAAGTKRMPSESRNIQEQERSIKSRAHEVFVQAPGRTSAIPADQAVSGVSPRNPGFSHVAHGESHALVRRNHCGNVVSGGRMEAERPTRAEAASSRAAARRKENRHPQELSLPDQLFDRLAAVDDLDRPAARGRVLSREVDAHGLGHGGDQVHHADGMVNDVDAVFVGGADDLAVFHAAAADHDRPASRPVIAARVLIDPRRAAELTHPDDRGRLEQPAVGQVGDQRRHALVELGEKPLRQRVEIVGVRVPAVERDLDIGHAAFDEPPGHQATRTKGSPAVGVADVGGLAIEVESYPGTASSSCAGSCA